MSEYGTDHNSGVSTVASCVGILRMKPVHLIVPAGEMKVLEGYR